MPQTTRGAVFDGPARPLRLEDLSPHGLILPPKRLTTWRLVDLVFQQRRVPYTVALEVGGISEQVEVSAESPIVDVTSKEVGGNIKDTDLISLPSVNRNFIGFVGNLKSRRMLHEVISTFRQTTEFPSEGGALPALVPGVGLSDQWAFWQCDYPGLMITDTAMFRYPHYHKPSDTPDKLDYERMARVVGGLEQVVRALIDPR